MKKSIICLLLVMVLTMTACAANSDALTATSEPTIIATVEPTSTERDTTFREDYMSKIINVKINNVMRDSKFETMSPEEVVNYLSDMVHISETETLSLNDMQNMAWSIYHIWEFNDSVYVRQNELEELFCNLFDNIYEQAVNQSIPFDKLSRWLFLPNADIMCKYFESNNFCESHYVDCYGFRELSDEDKVRVAETFFANPLFATNTSVPAFIIRNSPSEAVTDMAWNHFSALSTSSDSSLSSEASTERVCLQIFIGTADFWDMEKLTEIAKNILENPYYNFILKYEFFIDYLDGGYVDGEYFINMAFDSLIELAQNADEETAEQIKVLATSLDDDQMSEQLLSALENN